MPSNYLLFSSDLISSPASPALQLQRSSIHLNGNFINNTSVRKGPVYSQISQFNGNLTIKGVSVFAGNTVQNWTEYDKENKTTILWIGRNMNVRLGEAQWNATYAPNRTDFVLIVCIANPMFVNGDLSYCLSKMKTVSPDPVPWHFFNCCSVASGSYISMHARR